MPDNLTVSPEYLEQLAIRSAEKFFKSPESRPEEHVVSLISDQNLNEEHVRRICEKTNQNIVQHTYNSQSDKTAGYPLVDPNNVLEQLNPTKEAKSSDYDIPFESHFDDEKIQKMRERKERIKEPPLKTTLNRTTPEKEREKAASLYAELKSNQEVLSGNLFMNQEKLASKEWDVSDQIRGLLLGKEISVEDLMKFSEQLPQSKKYIKTVIGDLMNSKEIYDINFEGKTAQDERLNTDNPIYKAMKEIENLKTNINELTKSLENIQSKKKSLEKDLIN